MRTNDENRTVQMSAHVCRVDQNALGDWIVGCELIQILSPDELDALLFSG